MLEKFILIVVLAGQPPAQLGVYDTLAACQDAIREIAMAKIYVDARQSPEVQKAIDIYMKYQQEYICVKK